MFGDCVSRNSVIRTGHEHLCEKKKEVGGGGEGEGGWNNVPSSSNVG